MSFIQWHIFYSLFQAVEDELVMLTYLFLLYSLGQTEPVVEHQHHERDDDVV